MNTYLGIEFGKGYNKPFAEFKDEFGSNHIFREFLPKEREQKLKEAYKVATNGNVSGTSKLSKEAEQE